MCPTEGIFYYQKFIKSLSQTFLFAVGFFVMLSAEKEAIFLTIEEYIKSKEKFHLMPFVTIYTAIMELINDGYIEQDAFEKVGGSDVAVSQPKPERKTCRGLYSSGDFHSNR